MPRLVIEPRVKLHLYLPESVATELDLLCHDALRGKPIYGRRAEIVTIALREYFQKHRQLKEQVA